jgi:hypothetical protein
VNSFGFKYKKYAHYEKSTDANDDNQSYYETRAAAHYHEEAKRG